MRRRRSRDVWQWLLIAHAAVVAALTTLFFVLDGLSAPEDGANIGAGIVAIPLLPLGLPWSLPVMIDPYQFDGLPMFTWYVVTLGPAVLNVVLHGITVAVVRARRTHANRDR